MLRPIAVELGGESLHDPGQIPLDRSSSDLGQTSKVDLQCLSRVSPVSSGSQRNLARKGERVSCAEEIEFKSVYYQPINSETITIPTHHTEYSSN